MKTPDSEKAAFMGRITAGATHEMKNVLAIIKESGGLMQDIISLDKESALPKKEKLLRALANIAQQVARGVELSGRLNQFAHSSDEPVGGIDLNDTVDQVVSLSQRFARLKGVTLVGKPQQEGAVLVTDPLAIQMILFHGIDMLLSVLPSGTTVVLEPRRKGDGSLEVAFSLEEGGQHPDVPTVDLAGLPAWSRLQEWAKALNGTIEAQPSPTWFVMAFKSVGK